MLGPTVEDYAAKALTLDESWKAKFDTRSGLYVRGKLWRSAAGEPTAWDVEAPLDETEDALDRWTLWLRAGNDGSTQGVRVTKSVAMQGAITGQRIVKEWLGRASGLERTFTVAHAFKRGSLRAYVNGIGIAPIEVDSENGRFTLDFWPTARSAMRATYTAD